MKITCYTVALDLNWWRNPVLFKIDDQHSMFALIAKVGSVLLLIINMFPILSNFMKFVILLV